MSDITTITTHDGLTLQRRTWEPSGDRRASIFIVHGLGEHSGRYEHVGSALADAGYEVRTFDLRGHGASEGRRMHVTDFDQFVADVAGEFATMPAPRVLLGHSLGGLIATKYVLDAEPRPDLLVLSSPALGSAIPAVKKAAARVLGRLAPKLTIPNDFDGSQLSRDPAVGEAYFSDPLVETKTTTGLGYEALKAMDQVRERLGDIGVPTLVIHGGDDTIVPATFSAPLGDLPNVSRRLFPRFRHESFNEEGGAEAIAAVVTWLDEQLASQAS